MANIDLFFKNKNTDLHVIQITSASTFNFYNQKDTEPFSTIERLFDVDYGDLIVVIRAGLIEKRDHQRFEHSVNWLKTHNGIEIKRTLFFIEDLCVDSSVLESIKKMSKKNNLDKKQIFHCEKDFCFDKLELDVGYFDWYVTELVTGIYKQPHPIELNFVKKICCLNRRYGQHRYLASAFLISNDSATVTQQYGLPVVPRVPINTDALSENIRRQIFEGNKILQASDKIKDVNQPVETVNTLDYTTADAIKELNNMTADAFCSLVTESKYDSNMPNFSEKTLRSIYVGRPFVLLAPAGTLRLLKDLGFKTFGSFWDESYDTIKDPTERFSAVMGIVDAILKKDDPDLTPMLSVLEHNQNQIQMLPESMRYLP